MKPFSFILMILLGAAALATAGCHSPQGAAGTAPVLPYPVTIANFDGREQPLQFTYNAPPQRVVITHPGATELMLELGLDSYIAATVPPYGAPLPHLAQRYRQLKTAPAQYAPSQEELLELEPQLLIGWAHQFASHGLGDAADWNRRGIGTYILPGTLSAAPQNLDTSVYQSIRDLGKIFAADARAEAYIQDSQRRIAKIGETVSGITPPKSALILQYHGNGTFSLYDRHYLISHLLNLAGGINLCQSASSFIGAEQVLAYDPDVIVFVSVNPADSQQDLSDSDALAQLLALEELRSLRAVRQHSVINLPFFTVNNSGIRSAAAVEQLARGLYPGAFSTPAAP